ncbi:hypothetical protein THASP1DRAFT_31657 [Thamnocephalis sphaerospora]|uniref:Transcription factor TFIIIC triple barrel domain-containing protein n=1 Tax=Thamnocephalis sphaerospora TaxID=78915 RepID=A0A4P9XL17_9FUNG|nr:hypothetical protein THASP1DRAFT_31657 [Thamnocephalis sphaerospora]|eukprot:RKP06527.1 hypothetical protein THASP1DRAFT_31657 [Thamnocephalis sphaerospora]
MAEVHRSMPHAPSKESEEEEELEEFDVVVDLGEAMTSTMLDEASDYEFQGLDTAEPLLRIGVHYFRGTWDELVGTELVFAKGQASSIAEQQPAELIARTSKVLHCRLMQLQPRQSSEMAARDAILSDMATDANGAV